MRRCVVVVHVPDAWDDGGASMWMLLPPVVEERKPGGGGGCGCDGNELGVCVGARDPAGTGVPRRGMLDASTRYHPPTDPEEPWPCC